jgi:hypothetical protein
VYKTKIETIKVLAGVFVTITVITQACSGWKPDQKYESNFPNPPAKVSLASEVGANYTQLQNLLKARKYKEADQETTRMILFVSRRDKEGWLDTKAIDSFPCQDLRTIDHLWVQNSSGRFGFSVQRQVYNQIGKDWEKFADQVGWRINGSWKSYNELGWEITSPQAHLPGEWGVGSRLGVMGIGSISSGVVGRSYLFSRTETCNI